MTNSVQGTAMRVLVALNQSPIDEDLMALVSTPCHQVRVTLEGVTGDNTPASPPARACGLRTPLEARRSARPARSPSSPWKSSRWSRRR